MATNSLRKIFISYQWWDLRKLMCIQGWESPLQEDGLYNNVLADGSTDHRSGHLYQLCPYLVVPFLSLPIIYICRLTDILITFCFEELFGRVGEQSN